MRGRGEVGLPWVYHAPVHTLKERMSQMKTNIGGRYWGPCSPEKEKLNPESPNQASILLERINARARARKTAQLNDLNRSSDRLVQSSSTKFGPGEMSDSKQTVATRVDDFLQQMRNASVNIENVADDDKTERKKKKHKSKDVDEVNISVNGEIYADNEKTFPEKKKKNSDSHISSEAAETEASSINLFVKSSERKKKLDDDGCEREGKQYVRNTSAENQNLAHEVGNVTPKKKKKHSEMNHDYTSIEAIDPSVVNEPVVRSRRKKRKDSENEMSNDITSDVVMDLNLRLSHDSKVNFPKKKKKRHNDRKNGSNVPEDEGKKSEKKKKHETIRAWKEEGLPVPSSSGHMLGKGELMVKAVKKKKKDQDFIVVAMNGEIAEHAMNDSVMCEGAQEVNIRDETPGKKKKWKRKQEEDSRIPDTTNSISSHEPKAPVVNGTLIEDQDSKVPPKKKKQKNAGFVSETMTEEGLINVCDEKTKARVLGKRERNRLARERRKKAGIFAKQKRNERKVGDFTLLGEVRSAQKRKLGRTLPHWLAHPNVIGRDLQEGSVGLGAIPGLAEWLQMALEQNGVTQFFPVQRAVIPELLASAGPLALRFRPRDICVSAPTGSGKTLAYVLPILQALSGRTVPRIRALILLPVQELAIQVHKVFETYSRGSGLKIGLAVGQKSFGKEQVGLVGSDYRGQHCRVDILVATPGRLTDHLTLTPGLDLSFLRYLVLDEADRMLAAEGGEWVARIEQAVSSQDTNALTSTTHPPHRLLFSATLSHDPELLQSITLHHPCLFTVTGSTSHPSTCMITGHYVRPAELTEEYVVVDEMVKPLVLHHLISGKTSQGKETSVEAESNNEPWRKVLVFTNSLAATHRLAVLLALLAPDHQVAEFSSSAGKKEKRQQIVSQFAAGKIDILVSSDAMARGLDIPDIEHVVSYDVTSANTYVHRIGRTARAGRPGTALSLVTRATLPEFKRGLRNGGEAAREVVVSMEELELYEAQYIDALAKMKERLQEEEHLRREKLEAATKGRKSFKRGVTEQ